MSITGATIAFLLFGGLAFICSVMVVVQRNPTHSALFLILSFLNVACVYVLMGAEFVAVTQIIVYTGAILVLFLFAVMLVRFEDLPDMYGGHPVQGFVGPVLGVLLLLEVGAVIVTSTTLGAQGTFTPEYIASVRGNTQAVGIALYTDFLIPFEIASLVLLVGAIGAITLARPDDTPDRIHDVGDLFTISLGHAEEDAETNTARKSLGRERPILQNERETDRVAERLKPRR